MSPEELAAANEQLRNPPEFRLTSTARLGLYVVAKLAERHGIRVRLTESAYGGITAIVLLPGSLIVDEGSDSGAPADSGQLDSYRPAQVTGGGRHRLQTDADRGRAETATAVAVRDPAVGRAAAVAANGTHDPGHFAELATQQQRVISRPVAEAPPAAPPASTPAATPVAEAPVAEAVAEAPPAEAPATDAPAAAPEPPKLTPSGLPLRQRRHSPEPAASGGQSDTPGRPAAPARDPNVTRSMMASYRSGTLRGRSDAARLIGEQGPAAAPAGADPATPASRPPEPPRTQAPPPPWPGVDSPQWTNQARDTEEGG